MNADVMQYLLFTCCWTIGEKFLQVYVDESLYGTAKGLTSFDLKFLNSNEEPTWYGA